MEIVSSLGGKFLGVEFDPSATCVAHINMQNCPIQNALEADEKLFSICKPKPGFKFISFYASLIFKKQEYIGFSCLEFLLRNSSLLYDDLSSLCRAIF